MRKQKGLSVIAILVFLFLFLPLCLIVVTSFGTAAAIQFPIKGFTLDWYAKALQSETFMDSFKLSLLIGVLATVLALIVGIPASYALARYSVRGRNFIKSFFLSPTVIPGIVVGYTLFQYIVIKLGLPVFQGLLMGHFLISLPYIIRVVGSSMEQLDYSMEEVAWTLGCTRLRAFIQIVLPNVSSGPGVTMLPTSLLSYMEYNYDPTVSAISVLLMLLTMGLMFLIEKTLGLASIA